MSTNQNDPGAVICPKCGYQRGPQETAPAYECPRCGIVYAKFNAARLRSSPVQPGRPVSAAPPAAPAAGALLRSVPVLGLAILIQVLFSGSGVGHHLSFLKTIAGHPVVILYIGPDALGLLPALLPAWLLMVHAGSWHRLPAGDPWLRALGVCVALWALGATAILNLIPGMDTSLWLMLHLHEARAVLQIIGGFGVAASLTGLFLRLRPHARADEPASIRAMVAIFVGLTLLLFELYNALPVGELFPFAGIGGGIGMWALGTPAIPALTVLLFLILSKLRYRLPQPIPGVRLLAAGGIAYIALTIATGTAVSRVIGGVGEQALLPLLLVALALAPYLAGIRLLLLTTLFLGAFRLLARGSGEEPE